MTQEDKERIEKEAKDYCKEYGGFWKDFRQGAIYEHPIAFQQGETKGFNEGIEAAVKLIKERNLYPHDDFMVELNYYSFFEEIAKLKK